MLVDDLLDLYFCLINVDIPSLDRARSPCDGLILWSPEISLQVNSLRVIHLLGLRAKVLGPRPILPKIAADLKLLRHGLRLYVIHESLLSDSLSLWHLDKFDLLELVDRIAGIGAQVGCQPVEVFFVLLVAGEVATLPGPRLAELGASATALNDLLDELLWHKFGRFVQLLFLDNDLFWFQDLELWTDIFDQSSREVWRLVLDHDRLLEVPYHLRVELWELW